MADVKPEELDRLIRNSAFDNEYKNLLLKLESKISNNSCKMLFTSATEETTLARCKLLFFDEHKILAGTMEITIASCYDKKVRIVINTETSCDENETNRRYIESKLNIKIKHIKYTEKIMESTDIDLETLYDLIDKQYKIYYLADLLEAYKYDIVKVDNIVKSIKILNSKEYRIIEKVGGTILFLLGAIPFAVIDLITGDIKIHDIIDSIKLMKNKEKDKTIGKQGDI